MVDLNNHLPRESLCILLRKIWIPTTYATAWGKATRIQDDENRKNFTKKSNKLKEKCSYILFNAFKMRVNW